MEKKPRYLFLAGAFLLVITYFVPIWHIDLEAPQYPEGIGIYIWINQITGENPNDLNNLNNLNHYIGMKKIIPESIPELKILPFILAGMVVLAVLAFILNKRSLYVAWLALFVVLLLIGLYDFYMWEYDYGHDLDPRAAIKIPNMSYQPPLIGSKKLLNFISTSLPAIGGVIWGISLFSGFGALFWDKILRKENALS